MDKYVVLGVGAYVVEIDDILYAQYRNERRRAASGYEILGLIDSDAEKHHQEFFGFPVLGDLTWLKSAEEMLYVVSFINPIGRKEMVEEILHLPHLRFPNIIHPSAILPTKHKLVMGQGNIIAQGVIINSHVELGNFNHINKHVDIGHHCKIGDYNTMNSGAHIANASILFGQVFVGPGAVIIDGVTIGKRASIGANAVVRNNVPSGMLAVGIPARLVDR